MDSRANRLICETTYSTPLSKGKFRTCLQLKVLPIRRTLEVTMYFWEKPICIEEMNAVSSLDSSISSQADTGVQSNGSQSDEKPAYDGLRDPTFSPFSTRQAYEDSTDLEVISSAIESEQKECICSPPFKIQRVAEFTYTFGRSRLTHLVRFYNKNIMTTLAAGRLWIPMESPAATTRSPFPASPRRAPPPDQHPLPLSDAEECDLNALPIAALAAAGLISRSVATSTGHAGDHDIYDADGWMDYRLVTPMSLPTAASPAAPASTLTSSNATTVLTTSTQHLRVLLPPIIAISIVPAKTSAATSAATTAPNSNPEENAPDGQPITTLTITTLSPALWTRS
nr:unnamed protein product [Spirometra erinaceieuropaei]